MTGIFLKTLLPVPAARSPRVRCQIGMSGNGRSWAQIQGSCWLTAGPLQPPGYWLLLTTSFCAPVDCGIRRCSTR